MKGFVKMKKLTKSKIKPKKLIKWIILLLIIAAAAYFFINRPKPKKQDQEVMTVPAAIGNVESVISGTGTLNPANQYEVKSLVKGEILNAPFEEGDTVKKGELLYKISTSELSNGLKSAELGVEKSKNAYKDILEKKENLRINSTASGYVKKLYVKKGDTLQAGTKIADISDYDTMYIDLLFPGNEAGKTWIGKTASIVMDTTGETVEGHVTRVSSTEAAIDGGILTKKVTISVANEGAIRKGDMAEAFVNSIESINTGAFRPKTATSIVSKSDGKIESILVNKGDRTEKGDQIILLSSKELDSQIKDADLGITEAELTLDTQKSQMNQYTIKAPIAGQVITKNKKQGDTIDPANDTQSGPMAIVYDLSYLTFQMNIDELQIRNIKEGQKVKISSDSLPENTFDGVIERISLKGNTNNGMTTYPVLVKVEKYGDLLPGMNVTGKIVIEKADNVLTVPSSALQRGNIVYIKSKNAVKSTDPTVPEGFTAVNVEIGINDGTNVEIKKGIKEGDNVYIPFDTSMNGFGMYSDYGAGEGAGTDGSGDGSTDSGSTGEDGPVG
jgi:HlyD family secretion protein